MSHVYELRLYHVVPGKMDALLARFADHTEAIFRRHNFRTIGYWVTQNKDENLLAYFIEHDSLEAATNNWEEFRNDQEWQRVKAETEATGPLVVSIDRHFMDKIDISTLKNGVSSKT